LTGDAYPKSILITGATGGIGGALAEIYAEPGITLILQGRNTGRMAQVVAACEAKGARVIARVLDVRELGAYTGWLDEVCAREKIDLVFVNAGVNTSIGRTGEGERWNDVRELIEVNVLAAMATVHRILPSMRARKTGQIALISSLAAYFGLPLTPSYCASKAALKAYGEALRGWLAAEGIRVNVVMPGYVESAMCRNMPGPKPLMWTADKAARYIRRGLALNRPRISFPFPLNLGTWFLSVLPPAVSQRILRHLNYGG
jgi:short-subunit dehydrogenase